MTSTDRIELTIFSNLAMGFIMGTRRHQRNKVNYNEGIGGLFREYTVSSDKSISVRGVLAVRSPWYNRDCKEAAQFTQSAHRGPRDIERECIDRSTSNGGGFTPQIRNGEEEHNRGGAERGETS